MQLSTKDFTTEARDPPLGPIAVHEATGRQVGPVLHVGEEVGDVVQVEKHAYYVVSKRSGMTREEAAATASAVVPLWDIETDELTDGVR